MGIFREHLRMSLNPAVDPNLSSAAAAAALRSAAVQQHWYAAYTCANHEKQVATQLDVRAVEHFLPLYSSVRRGEGCPGGMGFSLFSAYVVLQVWGEGGA